MGLPNDNPEGQILSFVIPLWIYAVTPLKKDKILPFHSYKTVSIWISQGIFTEASQQSILQQVFWVNCRKHLSALWLYGKNTVVLWSSIFVEKYTRSHLRFKHKVTLIL